MLSRLFLFSFFFFLVIPLISSSQIVRGKVLDAETKKPLPFCNVICKSTNIGTITDKNGKFQINITKGSILTISFIGYKQLELFVNKRKLGKLYLTPASIILGEIKIVMKEDPAIRIMKESIKRKNYHRSKDNIQNLITQNLTRVYLSDPTHKFIGFNKSALFVEMSDSLPDGVPFFISDKRMRNDSIISNNNYGVGIENDFFINFIDEQLNFTFDVYDNLIIVIDKSIVSPLSNNAFSFYKFYLIDSSFVGNRYCYKIKLTKKRNRDIIFSGHVWVDKLNYAVQKIELEVENKYLNHLKGVSFYQEFNYKNGIRYESNNNIQFTISSTDLPILDSISILIKKNITRFEPVRDKVEEDSILETEEFLNDVEIIDSLNNDSQIKLVTKLSEIFISSYFTIGKVDVGPIYNIFSSNMIEGQRVSLLFRTNQHFYKNIMTSNYIGYGFLDKRFKYGAQVKLRAKTESSVEIVVSYKNDLKPIGDQYIYNSLFPNLFNPSGSDVFTSVFGGKDSEKMLYLKESRLSIRKDWKHFDASIYYSYKTTEKNSTVFLQKDIYQSILGINLGYSKSKKVSNHFDRFNVPKFGAPHFYADLTFSDKKYLSSTYNIIKAKFIVRQNVNTTFLGRTRYLIDLGFYKIDNDIPFALVEIHRGNESFFFDLTKSSLMNPYEFISDRYMALYIDQHLNGRIFNYIPLLHKLKIREIITANIVIGNLHNKFLQDNLPNFSTALNYNKPYAEVGVGIENIFKLIRINAIWRLTYLDDDVTPFGVVGGLYFSL